MSVEFPLFIPLPFDARCRDDAEWAWMARCQIMHSRCTWAVGAELERVRWTCTEEESIEHMSPFAMWINWHGDEYRFSK